MHKYKIVLIEDEEDIAALVKLQADMSGFKLCAELDGINGLRAVKRERPDIIILDLMLPGMNGLDICRKIKADPDLKQIPIIMLSAKSEEIDVILGLELGADDYVTKPFSPKILFSRVKALLRRSQTSQDSPADLGFGPFILETASYRVRRDEKYMQLTYSEFGILRKLLTNRGKVLTRNQLLDEVKNDEGFIVDRNIDVHVAALRRKLGPTFDWIITVRGVGYRFKDEDEDFL